MIQPLFAVFDMKAKHYLPPFTSTNKQTAIRQFSSAVSSEGHDFNTHATDYSLWEVGSFDSEKALVVSTTIEQIAHAHELLAQLALFEESQKN